MSNNLLSNLDALVGRAAEVAHVAEEVATPGLVSIVGLAGVGKTRLAVEVAASVADSLGGVWLVPLAGIEGQEEVAGAVASVVLGADQPGEGAAMHDALVPAIGAERTLLVLDTCDHVVAACADLVTMLLRACPDLTILATNHEPLAVAGERVFPLVGLGVPEDGEGMPAEAAVSWPAVELFCERARAKSPTFTLTDQAVPAVVEVCRRLDGLPLAIELAAAQVAVFSPIEIARRLDDRFDFLTAGTRDADPRHRTLRAALDWSHNLLAEEERRLLRRLSVFEGGYTVLAAEAVCGGDGVPQEKCVALISQLVRKSLVVAEPVADHTWYRFPETVRHYGRGRLAEAGETVEVASRHATWYAELAERAEAQLAGPGQDGWLARLDREHDNLRAALAHSVSTGPASTALRLAGALALFWRAGGHYLEGRSWLDGALALSAAEDKVTVSAALEARALWGKALLAAMAGDYRDAATAAHASLACWRQLDDREGVGRSLLVLGTCDLFTGGAKASGAVFAQAAALARQVGDTWCLAHALALGGHAHSQRGDASAAKPLLEEAVSVARAAQNRQSLAFALDALGHVAVSEGDYESAQSHLTEALELSRSTGGTHERAVALVDLARVAIGRGDHERARGMLADALALSRQTSSVDSVVHSLQALACLAQVESDLDGAEVLFGEALAVASQAGGTSVPAVQGLGEVALARGDTVGARAHFTRAQALAHDASSKAWTAAALSGLGDLEREGGNIRRAARLHHEALSLRMAIDDLAGVAASLEARAGLDALKERADRAARVFGAAHALREANGFARSDVRRSAYEHDVALARAALGDECFDAAWAEGAAMPVRRAVAHLSRARGSRRNRPEDGWGSLTSAEEEVVNLASRGFTNSQIAERMFVSPNTVKAHLKKVFVKLGISSRRDLTRLMTTDPP